MTDTILTLILIVNFFCGPSVRPPLFASFIFVNCFHFNLTSPAFQVENIVAGDARERLEMARHLSHINIRDESIDSASLGLTVASSHGESGGPSPRSSYIRPLSLRPYSAYYGRGSSSQLGMHVCIYDCRCVYR